MRSYWSTTTGKRTVFIVMIPLIVILNYLTGLFAYSLKIPFFLDTWATSLGVLVAGLPVGIAGGVLYNLIMALTVWPFEWWIFCLSSVWIAIITCILYRGGWINLGNPVKLILAGVVIGVTNAIVVILIHFVFFDLTTSYEGSAPAYKLIFDMTNSPFLALLFEKMITEVSDKLVSIFAAAMVLEYIPKKMRLRGCLKQGGKK
ncbi:hypothetical protein K9M79_02235 [Candidatus Woesearchaeota archaeon]|nr:hypothetical protein [Candidatus Woesearchaeota archaeon]